MNSKIKGVLSVVILSAAMVLTVVASGHSETIQVKMNSINLTVNGELVNEDNILYKGTTYVPMRAAGELLGKDVGWDPSTSTSTIDDKALSKNPYPDLSPIVGKTQIDRRTLKVTGSFEDPVGIPSSAILTETISAEKSRSYNYRVNLPGGGYIEKITVRNAPGERAYVSIWTYDSDNIFSIASMYDDGKLSFSLIGGKLNFNDEDFEVIRHEATRFLDAYGCIKY